MKNHCKSLLFSISAALPILYLTATALSSLRAAVSVVSAAFLMFAVTLLVPKILPENVKFPVMLIAAGAAVSVVGILIPQTLSLSHYYMPLCVVSAFLLFFLAKGDNNKKFALSLSSNSVAFLAVMLLLGVLRELFGRGQIFSFPRGSHIWEPIRVLTLPAGAIFIVAVLSAVLSYFAKGDKKND